jgi:hypothetical protein
MAQAQAQDQDRSPTNAGGTKSPLKARKRAFIVRLMPRLRGQLYLNTAS